MTWTYVPGAAIKRGQEMLAGSGDDHWTCRHEQQRSLQPETGVESTECFKKALKPVSFFFFPEGKIDSCAVYRALHLHGCSSMRKETPTDRTECRAFQEFLNHSTVAHYQMPRCASISECSMLKISCCATLTSSLATWRLIISPFAFAENEAKDGTDLKDSAFTGSLNCRYIVFFFF